MASDQRGFSPHHKDDRILVSNARGFGGGAGLSLIEILIVVTIISVLILVGLFAYRTQLMKGRDAKRKADLAKFQNALEDYLNDNICYPESGEITSEIPSQPGLESICSKDFAPYLQKVPCDPINSAHHNYFYSYDESEGCKSLYKIFTRLEIEQDPIVAEMGCGPNAECPNGGCGPSCNYNYWIGSANVTKAAALPGEYWWPTIPGVTPPGAPPPPAPTATPTPTPTTTPAPGVTSTPTPTSSPTPGAGPTDTPTPTPTPVGGLIPCGDNGWRPTRCGGLCVFIPPVCSTCCPGVEYRCQWKDGGPCCEFDLTCAQ